MKEKYKVFKDRETGKILAVYTITGTFEGEEEATRGLLAFENGISPDQIQVYIGDRDESGLQEIRETLEERPDVMDLISLVASFPRESRGAAAEIVLNAIGTPQDPKQTNE